MVGSDDTVSQQELHLHCKEVGAVGLPQDLRRPAIMQDLLERFHPACTHAYIACVRECARGGDVSSEAQGRSHTIALAWSGINVISRVYSVHLVSIACRLVSEGDRQRTAGATLQRATQLGLAERRRAACHRPQSQPHAEDRRAETQDHTRSALKGCLEAQRQA